MAARLERKTLEGLAKRSHFAAVLPLDRPYEPDVDELVRVIGKIVAPSGAKCFLHPHMRELERETRGSGLFGRKSEPTQTRMAFLVIDHVAVWIAARDRPLRHRGELTRWVDPEIWPEGSEAVGAHTHSVEIAELGFMRERADSQLDRAFIRAAAVTAAMAAVAARSSSLAVLWSPAMSAIRPQEFADPVARAVTGEAPLDLWMRSFLVQPSVGSGIPGPGVLTRGLAPFIGHEIEVVPGEASADDVLRAAREFATMVIDGGARARTGMIVALDRQLSATVRVGESATRPGLDVYELSLKRSQTARDAG